LKRSLEQLGVTGKILVLRNGVDADRFRPSTAMRSAQSSA